MKHCGRAGSYRHAQYRPAPPVTDFELFSQLCVAPLALCICEALLMNRAFRWNGTEFVAMCNPSGDGAEGKTNEERRGGEKPRSPLYHRFHGVVLYRAGEFNCDGYYLLHKGGARDPRFARIFRYKSSCRLAAA